MALGGCYSCIKYLMFAFNFLFWLLGCAIIGVGIWICLDPSLEQYVDSSDDFNYLYTGAYILISVGVISMVIGGLGCCGAIRESQCLLGTFFFFLFIIFIVLVGAGVWAIVGQEDLKNSVTETLNTAVKNYYTKEYARNLMDNVQNNFDCCGSEKASLSYIAELEAIPKTCRAENLATPCSEKLFEYFNENLIIIAGVGIGIGIVMILGMIFACCLCCQIRRDDRISKYSS